MNQHTAIFQKLKRLRWTGIRYFPKITENKWQDMKQIHKQIYKQIHKQIHTPAKQFHTGKAAASKLSLICHCQARERFHNSTNHT